MTAEESNAKGQRWWRRPAPVTVVGGGIYILLLTLAGDWLFKPSLNWAGEGLLSLLSLGSERIRDATYAAAALNPNGWAEFQVLSAVNGLAVGPLFLVLGIAAGKRAFRALGRTAPASGVSNSPGQPLAPPTIGSMVRSGPRKRGRLYWTVVAIYAVLAMFVLEQSLQKAQAWRIWRAFQNNAIAIAPYVAPLENAMYQSRFVQVRSKKEFDLLNADMQLVAKTHNVMLVEPDFWEY